MPPITTFLPPRIERFKYYSSEIQSRYSPDANWCIRVTYESLIFSSAFDLAIYSVFIAQFECPISTVTSAHTSPLLSLSVRSECYQLRSFLDQRTHLLRWGGTSKRTTNLESPLLFEEMDDLYILLEWLLPLTMGDTFRHSILSTRPWQLYKGGESSIYNNSIYLLDTYKNI